MAARVSTVRNDYRCSIERNQTGKYCVRILARYPRHAWTLKVFFLASSFDRAMKKLEEAVDFLQRNEEKLWFWGIDRAGDLGISAEFLREAGLRWTAAQSSPAGRPASPCHLRRRSRRLSSAPFAAAWRSPSRRRVPHRPPTEPPPGKAAQGFTCRFPFPKPTSPAYTASHLCLRLLDFPSLTIQDCTRYSIVTPRDCSRITFFAHFPVRFFPGRFQPCN